MPQREASKLAIACKVFLWDTEQYTKACYHAYWSLDAEKDFLLQ